MFRILHFFQGLAIGNCPELAHAHNAHAAPGAMRAANAARQDSNKAGVGGVQLPLSAGSR
jgi:hypothetical protein